MSKAEKISFIALVGGLRLFSWRVRDLVELWKEVRDHSKLKGVIEKVLFEGCVVFEAHLLGFSFVLVIVDNQLSLYTC